MKIMASDPESRDFDVTFRPSTEGSDLSRALLGRTDCPYNRIKFLPTALRNWRVQ